MPRHKAPENFYNQSELLATKKRFKPVELRLPPAHPKQYELISALDTIPDLRFVVGACGSKFGKCLRLSDIAPTPQGWKRFGDIKVGDYVFDEYGKPTLVEFVTDEMHGHKCYEVVFSDDNTVRCNADHLWLTETHSARKAQARVASPNDRCKSTEKGPALVTTEEIKNSLTVRMGGKDRPNHSIDVVYSPLEYPEQNLPLDPYVLGVWLGDGSRCGATVTCDVRDVETMCRVAAAGYKVTAHEDDKTWGVGGLVRDLKDCRVFCNKHVPEVYLRASPAQRLALLQGLMDTDGTIDDRGHCTFDNTNKNLADAVEELAVSLGIKVNRSTRIGKLYGVEKKLCYRVWFTTDVPVFRLQRKLDRIRPVADKAKRRYIVDVREIPSEPVKCIRVASPNHLFLIGKGCIPTHNTYGSTIAMVQQAWQHRDTLNWWIAPTYAQSKMAYNLIKRLLPVGTYIEAKADLRLTLLEPDGAEHSLIEFKSGDNPDSLRGFGVHFFVMDEAARCPYESAVSLMTTVTQTMGKGIFISTPHARNWFWEWYQRGEKFFEDGSSRFGPGTGEVDNFPEWFSIRMPTWTNPHVQLEAVRQMKKNLPEDVFRQEVAAQFLEDSAGVFRGIKDCVRGVLEPYQAGRRYVMGVDLARLKDYTVITVIDAERNHVVYFDRFNKIDWEVQYSRIISTAKRYRAQVVMDSTGIGDPIVSTIQGGGVPVVPYQISGPKPKQQLIEKLKLSIEQQKISFPDIQILRRELSAYEYKVAENGSIRYSSPTGQHDDTVISLALANWMTSQDPWVYRYSNQRGV